MTRTQAIESAGFAGLSSWPAPRYGVFCWSFTLSMFAIAAVAPYDSALLSATAASSSIEVCGALLQIVTALFATYVVTKYFRHRRTPSPLPSVRAALAAVLIVSTLMGMELLLEFLVIKPMFAPAGVQLRLPWLTHYFNLTDVLGTPSGFVMRQAMLATLIVSTVNQRHCHPRPNALVRPGLAGTLTLTLTVVVAISRIAAGLHGPFDVALGTAFGVYFYWWTTVSVRLVFSDSDRDLRYVERMMIPTIYFSIIPLLFARASRLQWMTFMFVSFGPLVFLYRIRLAKHVRRLEQAAT